MEWTTVRDKIHADLRTIDFNPDLYKLLKNIDTMITELSKLEVDARRTRINSYANEQVNRINRSIVELDKLIVFAIMIQ